ncbi:MAG: tRNA threonylcarbamoyladenosine biosynthesis protein TsaE [Thermodesulfobacteriota bacterium]|nr:tRNA threonylcarbamoyladenosine biosynthesis protein TsaE [Thermodesulfobacteriota bacterium]
MSPSENKQITHYISRKSYSEEETIELGKWIGGMLQPGDHIYLHGEIGTGKTRIAKGIIAQYSGIHLDDVVSPTFTLLNRYGEDRVAFHADFYRIDQPDIEDVGLEIVYEYASVLVVEWPEKMTECPEAALKVSLSYDEGENERIIVFEWRTGSKWDERMSDIEEFSQITKNHGISHQVN